MSLQPLQRDLESVELPSGWATAVLRELCLKTGFADPAKTPDREFDYVDVSSVSSDSLKIVRTAKVRGAAAPSRARKVLRASDVIFATVRPTLRRVALVPPSLDGHLASTAFCVVRADTSRADPRFLYYALITEGFIQRVRALERGASYPAVTDSNVLEQEILLPPLPEQRAIASALSKLQATVEVQDRIVVTLKELKSATMAKLFRQGLRSEPLKETEIGEIPESWEVMPIGEVFEIQLGKMLSQKARGRLAPKPYLRNANVQWGRFDLSDVYEMDFSPAEKDKFALLPGDLLVCEGGEVGRTALWRGEINPCFYQKALHRLRPKSPAVVLPEYYLYWSEAAFVLFKTHGIEGTTTTIAHLPAVKLAAMSMALPDLQEQTEIASALSVIDSKIRRSETRLGDLQNLFASTLRRLLTGRLRIQVS